MNENNDIIEVNTGFGLYVIKARRSIYDDAGQEVVRTRDFEDTSHVVFAENQEAAVDIVRREYPKLFNGEKYRLYGADSGLPFVHEDFVGFRPAGPEEIGAMMSRPYVRTMRLLAMVKEPYRIGQITEEDYRLMSRVFDMAGGIDKAGSFVKKIEKSYARRWKGEPRLECFLRPNMYNACPSRVVHDVWAEML